jgi:hypothetical protein
MLKQRSALPACTFVLRFWGERSPSGLHWRGRIEHVQGEECAAFCELRGLLDFIQSYGVMANSPGSPTLENEVCENRTR